MSQILTTRRIVALAVACVSVAACSRFRGHASAPASSAARPVATAPSRPPAKDAPSDANIAAILLAANNTDISYARLVPSRAESQAVKDFAQAMMTDHMAVNQQVMDLLNAINLVPEDNKTSLDFRDESANKRDIMRELSGRAFDTTYMANEVTYHQKLLVAIDSVLTPSARNTDLRRGIAVIRPAVSSHLARAQQIRARLTGR